MKFDRLSLKLKFGIGFGALLVILAVMGGVGYYSARMNAQIAKDVQLNTLKKEMMLEIQLAIEHRKTGGRDALLGQSTEKFEAGAAEYTQKINALKPLLTSETGRMLFAKIDEENAVDVNFVKKVIALSQSGDTKSALEIFYGPDMQQNRVDLKKNAVDLTAWYENLKQQALDKQAATNAHVLELLLGLAFAGVLMGTVIAVLITKSIVSAIQGIAGAIESISSNNLMIADLEVGTEDELGNAARGLNKMKNNLRQVILSIGATAENVSEASRELSMTAAQSASSADNQKNQVQQIAAAMMEMTATVRLVTEHSNSAVVSTTTAAESARDGGTIVADALARMHGISDTVRETAANIEQLGARSDEIGRIVGVIDEIATQTNLLALNAAIEAARAGEQGRGFAVVAGEVRRLAERTSSATNEIAAVIQNVQTMTMDAVQQMRTGMAAVEQGLTVTSKAGESIQRIIQESEKVGSMVTQIACAATEQSATTQQVNASMGTINKIAAESADGAQLSAQSCEQLFNLAIGLQNMVVRFKVGEGAAGGAEAKVPMVDWQNAA